MLFTIVANTLLLLVKAPPRFLTNISTRLVRKIEVWKFWREKEKNVKFVISSRALQRVCDREIRRRHLPTQAMVPTAVRPKWKVEIRGSGRNNASDWPLVHQTEGWEAPGSHETAFRNLRFSKDVRVPFIKFQWKRGFWKCRPLVLQIPANT